VVAVKLLVLAEFDNTHIKNLKTVSLLKPWQVTRTFGN
jgi:hypothetical protein